MRISLRAHVAFLALAVVLLVASAGSAAAAQGAPRLTTSTSTSAIRFGVTTPGGLRAAAELDQVTGVAGAAPSVVMAYSDFKQPLDVTGLDALAGRGATPMLTCPECGGSGRRGPDPSVDDLG